MKAEEEQLFMQQAIIEGRKALPDCLPNPPVGCVIVKDHKIIARGYTQKTGAHHAEAMALAQLPESLSGLTMFVTLEPCSFQGRTPSCAKTIVARKISTIYIGIIDPHPRNQGAGIAILKEAKIPTHVGLLSNKIQKELSAYLIQ